MNAGRVGTALCRLRSASERGGSGWLAGRTLWTRGGVGLGTLLWVGLPSPLSLSIGYGCCGRSGRRPMITVFPVLASAEPAAGEPAVACQPAAAAAAWPVRPVSLYASERYGRCTYATELYNSPRSPPTRPLIPSLFLLSASCECRAGACPSIVGR